LPIIYFDYQNFKSRGNEYTIAWTAAAHCRKPFHYSVVRVTDTTSNATQVGTNTSAVFTEQDIKQYKIYVKAVETDTNITCALSPDYLQLSSTGKQVHIE